MAPGGVHGIIVHPAVDEHAVRGFADCVDFRLEPQGVLEPFREVSPGTVDEQYAFVGQHHAFDVSKKIGRVWALGKIQARGNHDQLVGGKVYQAGATGHRIDVLCDFSTERRITLGKTDEAVTRLDPCTVVSRIVKAEAQAKL